MRGLERLWWYELRESHIESEFVKAIRKAGGAAYKLTSQTVNGLPDRLVLFFPAKAVFVELKAPGKMLRPLQRKRRYQLMKLGFPVLCIDRIEQIEPCIDAILSWTPDTPFPEGIGAKIPDIETTTLQCDNGVIHLEICTA
ncbi:MAG: VRR-NUC domain-containing protein [Alistipes sp.]|nr:VRR-NUC domain-containing protein [Alistipes sp.]